MEDDGEGEVISDIPFSLAYGGLLLLNHTWLRLKAWPSLWRSVVPMVCTAPPVLTLVLHCNSLEITGAGKSTLLKAINRHQIENFPEDLTTFYVEHDIDGVDADVTVIDFVLNDKFVQGVGADKARIDALLTETGFDNVRRLQTVGALSGGWKMRLALARALICGADILCLDEPTNHLDASSVQWLQDYLISQASVTVLLVSHDSGFLDTVCTDIIHYESKATGLLPRQLSQVCCFGMFHVSTIMN